MDSFEIGVRFLTSDRVTSLAKRGVVYSTKNVRLTLSNVDAV